MQQSQGADSLKAGSTNTLSLHPNKQMGGNMRGGPTQRTRMQAGATARGNALQKRGANKSKMKTTTSEKDNEYVKEGNIYVTPKRLISDKRKEMANSFINQEQREMIEKERKIEMKRSQSQLESSQMQSMDRSSGSDNKMSSSGIKDSSFQESKRSEDESLDDQRGKASQKDDKRGKKKQLSENEKEENVLINLAETETQFIFFIPSSLVPTDGKAKDVKDLQTPSSQLDYKQKMEIWRRNYNYDIHLKESVGSDIFAPRAAQTFNYEPKSKEQEARKLERTDTGCFAAVWDLYDEAQQDQPKDYEILQDMIKKNIDLELIYKLKNPFCLLPTDTKAISIHKKQEVPGAQYEKQIAKKGDRTNVGNTYGQTTQFNPNTSTQNNYLNDDSNKDSSGLMGEYSGKNIRTITKGYGTKTGNQELLYRHQKMAQEQIDKEEEDMISSAIVHAKSQPTDEEQHIMNSDSLGTYLKYVDRILNQNTYHKQYILYRNYPEVKMDKINIEDERSKRHFLNARFQQKNLNQEQKDDKDQKQDTLNYLFKFSCEETKGRTVSCADWNPVNKDLLACTYGELDLNFNQNMGNKEGYVMFWTLKNPSYPERIIKYPTRLTSCKFSQQNPNLLACGSYDGVVAIYDLRKKDGIPVAENGANSKKEISGKHSDAIWEVNWVGKGGKGGSDKGEGLVSISSDGRIVEWSMKKGLEFTDLMNLKRSSNPSNRETANEGVNFRQAAGFSIDFLKGESSMYLAATEDGAIHRCSKSYSEQYLDSYFGHTGPVFRVRCNPFWSDIFLSCSADWTCKLWNWKEENPIANFLSLDLFDEVMDIQWSPNCSTLFSSVCKDGRLELWDLEKNNMLDPFAQIRPGENESFAAKTMVRFAENAPVIITGDIEGDVNVYRLHGYEDQNPKDQTEKLQKLLYPTGYSKSKGERDAEEEQ